jgi:hypothetical protein
LAAVNGLTPQATNGVQSPEVDEVDEAVTRAVSVETDKSDSVKAEAVLAITFPL